jgi:hypothetical protein
VRDDGLQTCKHPTQPLRCGASPRLQSWEDVTTVDAPEFDDTLDGHAAVAIRSVCHAVVSASDGSGGVVSVTECGYAPGEDDEIRSRGELQEEELQEEDVAMCVKCWPEAVVEASLRS